ncbi:Fic family protein [Flavobacterium daejeonense]|uniref:Fic family protein n=1 Tax=Flavobacterium daejeonense TaxID=350893 RepID=UPI00047CD94F|nr:hypothetical protein [Flavobacterium daejeonense]
MANEEKTTVKNVVPFTNLNELSHFLKTLNDQAKANNIKHLYFYNQWSDQANDQAGDQATQIIKREINDKTIVVLEGLNEPKKRKDILDYIGLKNHSDNRVKYLDPLVNLGWIEMTIPEKPTHQDQKYRRSIQGEILYNLVSGIK